MVQWRLERGVAEQMNAFKKGFGEILPVHLLSNFDHQELEFITAGTLEIDIEDWKGNTEYRNGGCDTVGVAWDDYEQKKYPNDVSRK